MQSDLEEQHENTKLGEGEDYRIGRIEDSESGFAEDNTSDELSNHGWLANSLSEDAQQLCREQKRDKDRQQVGDRMFIHDG